MTMRPSVRDAMLAAVPSLRAFAISLCGNVDRADDLVQETLLRAMANIDSFQPGTNMSAWLFTILRNLFRSEYRKRRREVEDTDGSYAESLKSHPEQHSRVEFEELRGGGRHLRLRGRNDQEPGQPRTHAALGTALHRRSGRLRS
jgi:RNA polymerase sigma-70 factor (ECF subfamily)